MRAQSKKCKVRSTKGGSALRAQRQVTSDEFAVRPAGEVRRKKCCMPCGQKGEVKSLKTCRIAMDDRHKTCLKCRCDMLKTCISACLLGELG